MNAFTIFIIAIVIVLAIILMPLEDMSTKVGTGLNNTTNEIGGTFSGVGNFWDGLTKNRTIEENRTINMTEGMTAEVFCHKYVYQNRTFVLINVTC